MIRSMTAFAQAEHREGELAVSVEVRSVNSRYLDLSVRVFNGNAELEEELKKRVLGRLERGRVDVKITVSDMATQTQEFSINVARAKALHDAFLQLKTILQLDGALPIELFTAAGEVIVPAEIVQDPQACRQAAGIALEKALDGLVAMREREGAEIAVDFGKRLERLESWVEEIAKGSRDLLRHYQTRLVDRISVLTGGVIDLDNGRIAQEAALLADRSDISEELVRTRSHLGQFRTIMASDEPVGRKLNFLLQELGRELNTMGSKTEKAEFSHRVVEMKCELEKIREQVQNIE